MAIQSTSSAAFITTGMVFNKMPLNKLTDIKVRLHATDNDFYEQTIPVVKCILKTQLLLCLLSIGIVDLV